MPNLYDDKSPDYYSSVRSEILPLLPVSSDRVLELGCGSGATLEWLKSIDRCRETTGIEMSREAATAAHKVVDHVIIADIEKHPLKLPKDHFDLILCLDVLEHLYDPWEVLRVLVGLLRNNGLLIASIPNLRYRTVMFDLLFKCNFEYQNIGILDRTHLRFFTKKSAMELMKSSGLDNINVNLHPARVKGLMSLTNFLTFGYFRDMLAWQILISGKKICR